MPRNPKRPGAGLSTSFRPDEVDAFGQLLAVVRRGGDPRVLLRSEPIHSLEVKFARMREKLRSAVEVAS